MINKEYKINKECIGCRACVELSVGNFMMNDKGKAEVKKQPDTEQEQKLCDDAVDICPVFAIEVKEIEQNNENRIIEQQKEVLEVSEYDNVKKIIDNLPGLKQYLIDLSPKFKKLRNPFFYNLICRFVNFERAAKTVDIPVENLLERVNLYILNKSKNG